MDGFTILVVAESLALAQDLNIAFRRHTSVTVLGPEFDARAAHGPIRSGAVDVAIVDLDRTDHRGFELIEELRGFASVPVVGAADGCDPVLGAHVLAAGGAGVIERGADASRVLAVLRLAASGGIALPDDHLLSVVEQLHAARSDRRGACLASLTSRERQVLILLSEGHPPGQIAETLGISPSTVQAHIKGTFTKLQVHSQVEAVRVAWREGLAAVPASA